MTRGPIQPTPRTLPGVDGQDLLRRVLRVRSEMRKIERILLIEDDRWTIALRDTGPEGTHPESLSGDAALHVLWQRDEDRAAIIVNGLRYPIVPGDTITIPGGSTWSATAGMVIVQISGSNASIDGVVGPTHGEEVFRDYNRQTLCATTTGFALDRWKITQPLTLEASDDPYIIIDLADPLALTWPGGTDLIGRGTCRLIPPRLGPITLLPDGLGYALIVRLRTPHPTRETPATGAEVISYV